MAELNLNKMKEILKSKKMTYDDLAEITKISKSSISKIFGGFNQNPTLKYLKSIASALDCSIDDFFDWDNQPTSPYYLDRITGEIAQELHDNPDFRTLFDATKNLKPEDIKMIIDIANRIKGTYHNG